MPGSNKGGKDSNKRGGGVRGLLKGVVSVVSAASPKRKQRPLGDIGVITPEAPAAGRDSNEEPVNPSVNDNLRDIAQNILKIQISMLQNFYDNENRVVSAEDLGYVVESVEAVSRAANGDGGGIYVKHLTSVVDKFYNSPILQCQPYWKVFEKAITAIMSYDRGRRWGDKKLREEISERDNFCPNQADILGLLARGLYDFYSRYSYSEYSNLSSELNSEKWEGLVRDIIIRMSDNADLKLLLYSTELDDCGNLISSTSNRPISNIISLLHCVENGEGIVINLLDTLLNEITVCNGLLILVTKLLIASLPTNDNVINALRGLFHADFNKNEGVEKVINGFINMPYGSSHELEECGGSSVSATTGPYDRPYYPSGPMATFTGDSLLQRIGSPHHGAGTPAPGCGLPPFLSNSNQPNNYSPASSVQSDGLPSKRQPEPTPHSRPASPSNKSANAAAAAVFRPYHTRNNSADLVWDKGHDHDHDHGAHVRSLSFCAGFQTRPSQLVRSGLGFGQRLLARESQSYLVGGGVEVTFNKNALGPRGGHTPASGMERS
jgi:hypothetical protein